MSLTPADIKTIVAALQESDWDEAEVVVGDVRIAVARGGASLAPTPAPPSQAPAPVTATPPEEPAASAQPPAAVPVPASGAAADGHLVASPTVGVFWQAPEPNAEPFVRVGARVDAGETLCIVEVMKLMNNVTADVSGVITAVHVENGTGVEFGTPLFTIQPGA